jgi:enoyl-CoA hydratase/carnithine racemase
LLSVQGRRATLTLNRPRTGNSLDADLQASLTSHLKNLEADDQIRAVVLTGNGRFFCTGMNLGAQGEGTKGNFDEQFDRGKSALYLSSPLASAYKFVPLAFRMFRMVEQFRKPIIAIIQGNCYGGGNGLAMACDFRIATNPNVSFTLSEVKIGFIPAIISRCAPSGRSACVLTFANCTSVTQVHRPRVGR